MTPKEFVALFKQEKEALLATYCSPESVAAVSERIEKLHLSPEQRYCMNELLSDVLNDAFYTVLLGLDGCAQIGGQQIGYRLSDEQGNPLTGKGEIEAYAWEAFHGE